MAPITRLEHEKLFLHGMSLIEKLEFNDGSGEICDMLHLNQIDKIIYIIKPGDEHIKAMYKKLPNNKNIIHLTI